MSTTDGRSVKCPSLQSSTFGWFQMLVDDDLKRSQTTIPDTALPSAVKEHDEEHRLRHTAPPRGTERLQLSPVSELVRVFHVLLL